MFLKYTTREGNYNLFKPSEKSFNCHVTVYDNRANVLKSCNFTPEYELNGTSVEEIESEITESLDRYWSTSDDRKDMLKYLARNRSTIEKGNIKRRISEIKTEIDALTEELTELENKS